MLNCGELISRTSKKSKYSNYEFNIEGNTCFAYGSFQDNLTDFNNQVAGFIVHAFAVHCAQKGKLNAHERLIWAHR